MPSPRQVRADAFLSQMSWDLTWSRMRQLVDGVVRVKLAATGAPVPMAGQQATPAGGLAGRHVSGCPAASAPALPAASLTGPAPAGPLHPGGSMFDYLIVGAGFAGSVLAERLARVAGKKVLICDKRPHIGGNAYDHYDDAGVLVHKYGPHIFHTNSREVFEYLSQFTEWRPYEHRVRASVDGQLVPIPINLDSVNQLYGLKLTSFELTKFFESVAETRDAIRTSEDVIVSKVGTRAVREVLPQLHAQAVGPRSVGARCDGDRARAGAHQPRRPLFHRHLPGHAAPRLHAHVREHARSSEHQDPAEHRLPRDRGRHALSARWSTRDRSTSSSITGSASCRTARSSSGTRRTTSPVYQPAPVVNYPNEHAYTRVTEFKYLTGQEHPKTSIVYEYPRAEGDPYYPVPRPENAALYRQYQALAEATPGVHFVGRLATYKYYNMDQVVAQALTLFARMSGTKREAGARGVGVGRGPGCAGRGNRSQ